MQPWRLRRVLFCLAIVPILVGIFTVLGCDDESLDLGDFRQATAQDFATNSFSFSGGFFDPSLSDQRVILAFGPESGTTVPYTMSFSVTTNTVISGTGIVSSIQLQVDAIVVDDVSVASTSVGEVTFRVGEVSHTFEAQLRGGGSVFEFEFFNPVTGETVLLNNL